MNLEITFRAGRFRFTFDWLGLLIVVPGLGVLCYSDRWYIESWQSVRELEERTGSHVI